MKGKISELFECATDYIGGGDGIPWSTPDVVRDCERELAEAKKDESEGGITASTLRLSWALVHSRQDEERQLGIAMLEGLATNSDSHLGLLRERQKFYLLSVGYYRNGDYQMSMDFVDRCLKISPYWEEALSLKKTIEKRGAKDYWSGIGIAAATVGGGIAAAAVGTGVVGGITAAAVRRGIIIAAGGIVAATATVTVHQRAAASAEKN